jgi:hypothetical protein
MLSECNHLTEDKIDSLPLSTNTDNAANDNPFGFVKHVGGEWDKLPIRWARCSRAKSCRRERSRWKRRRFRWKGTRRDGNEK